MPVADILRAPASATRGRFGRGTPPPFIVGAQFTSLTLTEEAGAAGLRPYVATIFPLRGQVPAGSTIGSSSDATARGAILSAWDDGSAAVVLLSGAVTLAANASTTIPVNVATGSPGAALTTAAISARVQSVAVDFGGTYGVSSITSFSAPERIWWATPGVICARYRVAAPSPGSTALEAVIDIHAYADRALVEVQVENGKLNPATPVKPAAASYTGAVVSVNGSAVTTVNGNGGPEGSHTAFRGWYASAWVGANPGIRAHQSTADLQNHPLLWRMATAGSASMAGYASDAYVPWTTGRQRAAAMGGPGDHESIGPLPLWEAQWLQTGDYRAARAVETSALAVLGYNIGFRNAATGTVPLPSEVAGKDIGPLNNWPTQTNGGELMTWDFSHQPAVGLAAFLVRPSPVYIELAQKAALWTGLFSNGQLGTGTWHYAQVRGRAWGYRGLTHAIWLTPDAHPWKSSGKTWLAANAAKVKEFKDHPRATLGYMWAAEVDAPIDFGTSAGYQMSLWEHHFMACEFHKAAAAKLLSGSQQAVLDEVADWLCTQPVRWVNEQANGGWRYAAYKTTLASSVATMGTPTNYGTWLASHYSDAPSGVSGQWMVHADEPTTYASFTANPSAGSGLNYARILWSALATAVLRGVAGASTAMSTVQANITGLSTWLAGFGTDPRHGVAAGSAMAMPAWAPAPSSTPGNVAVRVMTVANGYLQNNAVSVHAPYYDTYFNSNIYSVYSGSIYSPHYVGAGAEYGGLFSSGGGHASTNNNTITVLMLGNSSLRFHRINDPTPFAGTGTDATTRFNNETLEFTGAPYIDSATCVSPIDGQVVGTHTWGSLGVRPPSVGAPLGSIVLPIALVAGRNNNQSAYQCAFSYNASKLSSVAAVPSASTKWQLEYVSPTRPTGTALLSGISPPSWRVFDEPSGREYILHAKNNGDIIYYDASVSSGDRYVTGTGTKLDTTDISQSGAPPAHIVHVPSKRVAVIIYNVAGSSPRRLAAKVFDLAAGSWNNTRREFSLQIPVDVDWSCAAWSERVQRLVIGDIQGPKNQMALVEIPSGFAGVWPATQHTMDAACTQWRTTRSSSGDNATDYGAMAEVMDLGLMIYHQQHRTTPDSPANLLADHTSEVFAFRLPGV